jgi:ABC-type branched-subunit amino acid transport system permease subunit
MYDTLAELFVYAFALLYAILFLIVAQRWIRTNLGRNPAKRRSSSRRPPSVPIQL